MLTVARRPWLLVPASPLFIDLLATIGAEFAECEWTLDEEEEQDDDRLVTFGEPDDADKEADPDHEYDLRTGPRTPEELQARSAAFHKRMF